MMPLKPAMTYEQQVARLIEEHGLVIGDRDEAREILSRVNYYRLSAYGIGLKRTDDKEKYIEGTSLARLYRLYVFDGYFRSALFFLIEQAEIEIRTQVAYHFSLKYGPEGYCDVANFADRLDSKGESIHGGVMARFRDEVRRQAALPCVVHHKTQYGGHFPAWAAVELFTFGMVSSLYSIMKSEDQKVIADFYSAKNNHLKSWLLSLVEVRNRCAHYGRIYNMPLAQAPFLYTEHALYRGRKVFPVILVLRRMMSRRPAWTTFLATLEGLIENHPEVNLGFIGFPENWLDVLKGE